MVTSYVLIVGGQLNGPTLGGIFAVIGFGAYGKHLKKYHSSYDWSDYWFIY